jgi:mannose-6-phosphate isomerase-like protein (cupin superfamily)
VQRALGPLWARWRAALLAGDRTLRAGPLERLALAQALRAAGWTVRDTSDGVTIEPSATDTPQEALFDSPGQPEVLDLRLEATVTEAYRRELWTGGRLQVTAMRLGAGERLGAEVHPGADQLLLVVAGGPVVATLDGRTRAACDGDVVAVPAGTRHDVEARAETWLVAVYAPPLHRPGTVHLTRADTEADSADEAYGAEQQAGVWLPARYGVGVAVPGGGEGGARCSTCRFGSVGDLPLEPETGVCYNRLYQRVETQGLLVPGPHGGRTLPASADAWCCPFWVGAGADGAVAGDDTRGG